MAAITSPEAIRFCNERLRPAADKLARAYYEAKAVTQEWQANNMVALIDPLNAGKVADGSDTDGRHRISGVECNALIGTLQQMTADFEAGGAAKLNTVMAVAVNP